MTIYTMKNWQTDGTFKARKGQEVEKEVYYNMLNCMPPVYHTSESYQMGEPYSHELIDGKYYPLYSTFAIINSRYFFIGYCVNSEKSIIYNINQLKSKLDTKPYTIGRTIQRNNITFHISNKTGILNQDDLYNLIIDTFIKQTMFHNDLKSFLYVFDFQIVYDNISLWVESTKISNDLKDISLQVFY